MSSQHCIFILLFICMHFRTNLVYKHRLHGSGKKVVSKYIFVLFNLFFCTLVPTPPPCLIKGVVRVNTFLLLFNPFPGTIVPPPWITFGSAVDHITLYDGLSVIKYKVPCTIRMHFKIDVKLKYSVIWKACSLTLINSTHHECNAKSWAL